jgi:ribose transport system permease protein
VFLTIATPGHTFLTGRNLFFVLLQISVNTVLAAGMTLVILTAGIDLSIGSVVALAGVVGADLAVSGVPVPVAAAAALGIGAIVGLANGAAIVYLRVAPFIATLATMTAVVLTRTVFGRRVYAVGGNEEATRLSGVRVGLVKLKVYALMGLLAGLGGLILAARLGSGDPKAGQLYELNAIAAVVVGGTSLMGGRGGMWGTVLGALIIGVLDNGLVLMDVSAFYQMVVKGLVILAAVALDRGGG